MHPNLSAINNNITKNLPDEPEAAAHLRYHPYTDVVSVDEVHHFFFFFYYLFMSSKGIICRMSADGGVNNSCDDGEHFSLCGLSKSKYIGKLVKHKKTA